jgi:hypothetical protein
VAGLAPGTRDVPSKPSLLSIDMALARLCRRRTRRRVSSD